VKIGAENKKAMRWMIALLGVALLVIIYDFADFGTSSAAPPAASTSTAAQKKTTQVSDNTLDPRFRTDILAASQNKKYETGRNIFQMEEAPIEKTLTGVREPKIWTVEAPPTPTPPPPAPPIPLKFYGFASKANEPKRVFLADADEVFVAKQGDIVERKYKVIQINNASVIIEDLLYNNRQPIPLTAR
jgi:hypothetical protein